MKRLGVVAVEDGVALTSSMQHTKSLRPVFNHQFSYCLNITLLIHTMINCVRSNFTNILLLMLVGAAS